MSKHDPALSAGASTSEAAFRLAEAFYSRTDKRGVILAGNEVFQRVAGHDWDSLIGAPHKIIRHPDMPKGLFHLLWDRIKAGHPTGAFIKNRRACGRFYWVFALIAPTEGGYISTRIKPVSSLRGDVEVVYAEMLKREQDGATPAESAQHLRDWLRGQGFTRYESFQSHAMATEFEARARKLQQPLDPVLKRFADMSKAISDVWDEAERMTEVFQAIVTAAS